MLTNKILYGIVIITQENKLINLLHKGEDNMYKCPICNKEFSDLDNLVDHVKYCAAEKKKSESKRLEKLNADLNRVKQAEKYFKEQLDKFEKEYPEEFEMNFPQYGKKKNIVGDTKKSNKDKYDEEMEILKGDPFVNAMLKFLLENE